jgi:hypothetical protein
VEAGEGDGLAVAPPFPPALLQAAAVMTAMTVPAPASHRSAVALRGPAWATRPLLVLPGTRLAQTWDVWPGTAGPRRLAVVFQASTLGYAAVRLDRVLFRRKRPADPPGGRP